MMADEKIQMDDELMQSFGGLEKNEMAEVLKELFDEKKVYMIGDLSKDEIKLATRIYMIAKMKNIGVWEQGLEFFCKMMLSKDRKSRRELLDAIRGYQQKSLLQKMNPFSRS